METSDDSLESTNKVTRIEVPEPPPQRRPIPSVLQRNAAPKPAPTFTWPLTTAAPTRPSSPPARAPIAKPITIPPLRAPRGTDAPPARVEAKPARVEAKPSAPVIAVPAPAPVIEIAAPAPVIVAAPVIETPVPAPVIVAPTPAPVPAEQPPTTFGSGMLQARARRAKPIAAPDELAGIPAAPTFGAGVLQARANGTKKLVIALAVAIVTIAALCMAMRSGSNHVPPPAATQQP